MTDGREPITGLPHDEAMARILASELTVELLARDLDVEPLRLASILLVAYRCAHPSKVRAFFEEASDKADSLAREHAADPRNHRRR